MDFSGATFDSRKVKPGMLFVALKGEHCDGRDYIPQALEKGADTDALVDALTAEYEVERAEAAEGVEEFLATLRSVGCLEE
jgi:UDP-N-acetylmuramyl pentapeptide synthase